MNDDEKIKKYDELLTAFSFIEGMSPLDVIKKINDEARARYERENSKLKRENKIYHDGVQTIMSKYHIEKNNGFSKLTHTDIYELKLNEDKINHFDSEEFKKIDEMVHLAEKKHLNIIGYYMAKYGIRKEDKYGNQIFARKYSYWILMKSEDYFDNKDDYVADGVENPYVLVMNNQRTRYILLRSIDDLEDKFVKVEKNGKRFKN